MKEFAEILTDELESMWRFALRLTSNEADAEDLVQRTCVKALENAHSYQEQGRLRGWLFRIEHRIWLNILRSRQMRNTSSFSTSVNYQTESKWSGEGDADNILNQEAGIDEHTPESMLQLHQILLHVESLPDAQRLVVLLVCVEGFSYSETADILAIPIGTVMSRLARARMKLGKAILAETNRTSNTKVALHQ